MKAWGSTRTGKDPGRAINLNLLPWLSFCDHVFSSMAGSAILINLTLQFQGLLLICTNFKKSRSMWSDVIIYRTYAKTIRIAGLRSSSRRYRDSMPRLS